MNLHNHHPTDDLLAAYALGALDADEAMRVETTLANNPEAQAELKALSEIVAMLPYAAQPIEPSNTVKQQLFARVAADQAQDPPAQMPTTLPPVALQPQRGWRMASAAVMAILLLLIVGLGSFTFSLQSSIAELQLTNQSLETRLADLQQTLAETQTSQQQLAAQFEASQNNVATLMTRLTQEEQVLTFISAPGVATRILEATNSQIRAAGEMYMYPGQTQAVVLFRGLSPLESGRVYQFWLANNEGQVDAGIFHVDESGLERLIVNAPREVNAFTQVMLTIEPEGGSDAPSSEVVLEGSL
ncbi:MAG: anti-sigma factor [Chloroflexales bacterium]|nr:anti-sigma factor [Chloroflexales bacterium]